MMLPLLVLLQHAGIPSCGTPEAKQSTECALTGPRDHAPIDAGRAIAEFMAVCVKPEANAEKVAAAAQASDFGYKALVRIEHSQRWAASRGLISLELPPTSELLGYELPQCVLEVSVSQAWTKEQFLAALKPIVGTTFDLPVEDIAPDPAFKWNAYPSIAWATENPNVREHITVWATGKSNQVVNFLLENYSSEGWAQHRRDVMKLESRDQGGRAN